MSNVDENVRRRPVITSDIYGCREAVDEGISDPLGRAGQEQFDKKQVIRNTIRAFFSPTSG